MQRGPLLMVFASLAFTAMVGFVKVARQELGPLEIICWRSIVALPLTLLFAKQGLRIRNHRVLLMRVTFGFGAMVCFFTAAKGLALGDLAIISRFQPIALALLAPLVLGRSERSGRNIWVVLAAGMVGCALVIGPDLEVGSTYGLIALVAALLSAAAHLCVRKLGATESPIAIVFWFQVAALVYGVVAFATIEGHLMPIPSDAMILPLLGVGVCASVGQLFMTYAYKIDKASRVAAASYLAPVFGMMADVLFFSLTPTWFAIAGGMLVVGAGLYLIFSRAK